MTKSYFNKHIIELVCIVDITLIDALLYFVLQ
jgi:hypothetical protein